MERWVEASTSLRSRFDAAVAALTDERAPLLAPRLEVGIDVGVNGAVTHAVDVEVGPPRVAEGEAWCSLAWEPVGHATVIPGFDGTIEITGGDEGAEVRVFGSYRIPLGVAGRFGDGILGRRIARRSLEALVREIAGEIDNRAHHSSRSSALHSAAATYLVRVRDRPPKAVLVRSGQ